MIVQDAACAVGSVYRGRPAGAGAFLAAYSFHPRKLLTTGEGGMVVTTDEAVAARLRRLREHGMDASAAQRHASRQPVIEHYLEVGFNYRMTDVQAAIGLVQLAKLDRLIARRRALAARYQEMLAGLPGLSMAGDPAYGRTNYQSFWVLLPDGFGTSRDDLLRQLADGGHLGAARHHGRAHRARLRRAPPPPAAGHRAADRRLAHPAALPPDDRGRAGSGGVGPPRRRRGCPPRRESLSSMAGPASSLTVRPGRPGLDGRRLVRLMTAAIQRCELDLAGRSC